MMHPLFSTAMQSAKHRSHEQSVQIILRITTVKKVMEKYATLTEEMVHKELARINKLQ